MRSRLRTLCGVRVDTEDKPTRERIALPKFNTDKFPQDVREQRRAYMKSTYSDTLAAGATEKEAALVTGYALALFDVHASIDFANALADAADAGITH